MNRPADFKIEKQRTEPLAIKTAILLRMFKDQYSEVTETSGDSIVEVPYCLFSALQMIKANKNIAALTNDNSDNKLAAEVD